MKATSNTPPAPVTGRPVANGDVAPVLVSTRTTWPPARSATYSAPSGPMVLPIGPASPVASSSATGSGAEPGGAAFAAAGRSTAGTSATVMIAARNAARLVPMS